MLFRIHAEDTAFFYVSMFLHVGLRYFISKDTISIPIYALFKSSVQRLYYKSP